MENEPGPPPGMDPWHIVIGGRPDPVAPTPARWVPPGATAWPTGGSLPAPAPWPAPAPGWPPPYSGQPLPWPPYATPPVPPARRSTPSLVLAVVLGVLLLAGVLSRSTPSPTSAPTTPAGATFAGAPAGPYSFEHLNVDGQPARFDPCTAIHYVVNDVEAPVGGVTLVRQGFAHLAAATGLTFVYDGTTTEHPQHQRPAYQPDRYGAKWAPVLVSWTPLADTDMPHRPSTLALTAPATAGVGGRFSIVSAEVVLDVDHPLLVAFGGTGTWGGVLLHELGHAVGLGHVRDRRQLMYPTVTGSQAGGDYAAGDREGLAQLGRDAGCAPAPPPGSGVDP